MPFYNTEILGAIFAVLMIYFAFLSYKRKHLRISEFIFWLFVWLGSMLLVFLREQVNLILKPLNIIRALDLYMILAFMFLFALVFYLFARNSRTEARLETITRALAIKKSGLEVY